MATTSFRQRTPGWNTSVESGNTRRSSSRYFDDDDVVDEGEFTDDSVDATMQFPGTPLPNDQSLLPTGARTTIADPRNNQQSADNSPSFNSNGGNDDSAVLPRSLPKYVAVSPVFVEPSLHGSDLSKLLYWKCVKGDVVAVRTLLNQKADVNYTDRVAGTPLHGACRHNQLEVAQLLLDARAEVNAMPRVARDDFVKQDGSVSFPLQTPLYYACRDNNQGLIDFLLMRGAAIDFVNKQHGLVDSPLNCAQQYGHLQLFLDLEQLIGTVATPVILQQPPQSEVVLEGQALVLHVRAQAADYPLTYQWYHDDAAIPGANSPRLRVDVVHKLMHEGTYCCFVRAMYSKLTGLVEFPATLAGGQPAPGTSGSNDIVSDACLVRVESMVERLSRLRDRISGQSDELVALRARKQTLDRELAEVRYQLDALRPQVQAVQLDRDSATRRLRAELEKFLRLKKSCLVMMEDAGQTVAGLSDFDVHSDLDMTMQRIIAEEKLATSDAKGARMVEGSFFDSQFKSKIDTLTERVEHLGKGTFSAVAKYEAAGAAWNDAYRTFQQLREDASRTNSTNEIMRDFQELETREQTLSQELEQVHRSLSTTTQELNSNQQEQGQVRQKYETLQDLIQNAFEPLYRGDDEGAIDAVKQLFRREDLKLSVAIVLCQITKYLARKPANAQIFLHRAGLVSLLQRCGARFGHVFEAHKDAVVALLLGASRKGRQYTTDELRVFKQLQVIEHAQSTHNVAQLLDFVAAHRFYFETAGGGGGAGQGVATTTVDDSDRGGTSAAGPDRSNAHHADEVSGLLATAPNLPVTLRRLVVTATLDALQKSVSSNPYAALAFVQLRGNVLLHELLDAEFALFSSGNSSRAKQQGNHLQASRQLEADYDQKHTRGRIQYVLEVSRAVHNLWSSGHPNSLWTNAVNRKKLNSSPGITGSAAASSAFTAASQPVQDILASVLGIVDEFRGVSLGRFEAFQGSSDLSLWFRQSTVAETTGSGSGSGGGGGGDAVNGSAADSPSDVLGTGGQHKPLSFAMVLSVVHALCHAIRRDDMVSKLVTSDTQSIITALSALGDLYRQTMDFFGSDRLPPAFQPWYQDKASSGRLLAKLLQTIDQLHLAFYLHFSSTHSAGNVPGRRQDAAGRDSQLLHDLQTFGVTTTAALGVLDVPRLTQILQQRQPSTTQQQARVVLQRLHFNLRKFSAFLDSLRDSRGVIDFRQALSKASKQSAVPQGSRSLWQEQQVALMARGSGKPEQKQAKGRADELADDDPKMFHLLDGGRQLVVWLQRRGLNTPSFRAALIQNDIFDMATFVDIAPEVLQTISEDAGLSVVQAGALRRDTSELAQALPLDVFELGRRRWRLEVRVEDVDPGYSGKSDALSVQILVQQAGLAEQVRVANADGGNTPEAFDVFDLRSVRVQMNVIANAAAVNHGAYDDSEGSSRSRSSDVGSTAAAVLGQTQLRLTTCLPADGALGTWQALEPRMLYTQSGDNTLGDMAGGGTVTASLRVMPAMSPEEQRQQQLLKQRQAENERTHHHLLLEGEQRQSHRMQQRENQEGEVNTGTTRGNVNVDANEGRQQQDARVKSNQVQIAHNDDEEEEEKVAPVAAVVEDKWTRFRRAGRAAVFARKLWRVKANWGGARKPPPPASAVPRPQPKVPSQPDNRASEARAPVAASTSSSNPAAPSARRRMTNPFAVAKAIARLRKQKESAAKAQRGV